MRLAGWAVVGVGMLVVFALGLWLGASGLRGAPQPVTLADDGPPVGATGRGAGSQPSPPATPVIPTTAGSELSQVPLPPVRSVVVEPEEMAVKGNPDAPVTIVEYSDYQ